MTRAKFIDAISSLDARLDENIENYFVKTDSINAIRSTANSAFAVVGLKGTGKSTLFRSLVERWGSDVGYTTIGLSTDTASFESYFDKVNCLQFERSVRTGMMLFMLKKIDENISRFVNDKYNQPLSQWIKRRDKIFETRERVSKLVSKVSGLSVMGVEVSWAEGAALDKFNPISSDDKEEIKLLLNAFKATGHKLRIVIDDPDRLFTKGVNFDPHLLAGYILGTNWISSQFEYVQFLHVLKSSVYDMLWDVEEMANLSHDYFKYISWKKEELKSLIHARIEFSGVDVGSIFEDNVDICLDCMISRLRNGPRDLLRYMEVILKSQSGAKISLKNIDDFSSPYRREARRQMESVYSGTYEGIDIFSDYMLNVPGGISVHDFKEKFEKARIESQPFGVNYSHSWIKNSSKAIKALVDAGIVDLRMDGDWVAPFEGKYFRFNSRDASAFMRKNYVFT